MQFPAILLKQCSAQSKSDLTLILHAKQLSYQAANTQSSLQVELPQLVIQDAQIA